MNVLWICCVFDYVHITKSLIQFWFLHALFKYLLFNVFFPHLIIVPFFPLQEKMYSFWFNTFFVRSETEKYENTSHTNGCQSSDSSYINCNSYTARKERNTNAPYSQCPPSPYSDKNRRWLLILFFTNVIRFFTNDIILFMLFSPSIFFRKTQK